MTVKIHRHELQVYREGDSIVLVHPVWGVALAIAPSLGAAEARALDKLARL